MKFWAKVRFTSEKNAEYLIRSFFKEFNPESSILIRGKEAKVEIIFDKPPMEIIQAITECNLLEFRYGKTLREYNEDEITSTQFEKHKELSNDETQVVTSRQEQMSAEEGVCEQSVKPESNIASTKNLKTIEKEIAPHLSMIFSKLRPN